MARVLSYLIRYFSNYYTLHRSDLAARAAPLDPRLPSILRISSLELSPLEFTMTFLKFPEIFHYFCIDPWKEIRVFSQILACLLEVQSYLYSILWNLSFILK